MSQPQPHECHNVVKAYSAYNTHDFPTSMSRVQILLPALGDVHLSEELEQLLLA